MIDQKHIIDHFELLQVIMDHSPDIVWVIDSRYCLVYGNKSYYNAVHLSGIKNIELGNSVLTLENSKEFNDSWVMNYNRCLKNEIFESESSVEWTDGPHFIKYSFYPYKNAAGDVLGAIVFGNEITHQVLTKCALQESEEKFRLIFENTSEAILFTKPDGKVELINPEASRIFGYTNEEFTHIGRNGVIDQNDPRLQDALEKRLSQNQFKGELNLIKKDGTVFPGEITSNIFIDSKGTIRSSIILKDISERLKAETILKESEEKYRTLFENINYGFELNEVITDSRNNPIDFRVIEVNKYFEGFTGKKQQDIKGKTIKEFCPDADENMIQIYGNVALTGIPLDLEYYSSTFNKYTHVHIFCPKAKHFAVLFEDITERKKIEETLKLNEKLLKDTIETKDKLYSIIAHDLRNPFNAILGFINLLLRNIHKSNFEKTEEYIEHIKISAENMLNLLDNLLAWAKTQTGLLKFRPQPVRLSAVMEELSMIFETSFKIKNINLQNEIGPEIFLHGDINMLKTILSNLISNSIKFTNEGGSVNISAKMDNNYVEICVKDNGIGMDTETINQLFNKDIIKSKLGTVNEKGTGLGLIICKEFIERHHGKIWVESEPGVGSKFIFTLQKNKYELPPSIPIA